MTKRMTSAERLKATKRFVAQNPECTECRAYLIGNEKLGTVCNECLDKRVRLAKSYAAELDAK